MAARERRKKEAEERRKAKGMGLLIHQNLGDITERFFVFIFHCLDEFMRD